MEEDLKILEEFVEAYRIAEEVLDGDVIQAIENLIERYKELKQKYNNKLISIQKEREEYEKDYIPKSKIKEKIEDYTEKSKHPLVNAQSRREYTFGIKALQELIED